MSTNATNRRCILFVDDDSRFLEMIERIMGVWSQGTWEILTAPNTGKALSLIQDHTIHLVVIDVLMPVVDGLQFLTLLHRKYPNLQKVVLTGYANDNYRAACLSNGAELFLEKPTTLEGLEGVFCTLNEVIKWQPEEGFRGVLRQVGLQDVLQMECLSRNSSVLEVTADARRGEIFIKDGAIIHAVAGHRTGEAAFNHLLGLKGGEFRLKPFSEPDQQTISGSWEFLLMEAARMRDEGGETTEAVPEIEPAALPEGGQLPESAGISSEAPQPEMGKPPSAPVPEPEAAIEDRAPRRTAKTGQMPSRVRPMAMGAGSAEDEIFPTRIDEVLICSTHGDVLYEWQCPNSDLWINFLEFISQKSRQLGQGLALGSFDRLVLQGPNTRLVAHITASRGVLVRSSKSAPEAAAPTAA